MKQHTLQGQPDRTEVVDAQTRSPGRGEVIARTVAFVGGASLLLGGLLGYAFGFLDGASERRKDDHEV